MATFPRARANAIVLVSMMGTAAIIVVGEASRGELPKPRRLLALGGVYVGLAAMATAAPALAAPFALMVLTGTALARGQDAAEGVLRGVQSDAKLGTGAQAFPIAGSAAGGGGGGSTEPPLPSVRPAHLPGPGFRRTGGPNQGTHTLGNWQSDTAYDLMGDANQPVYLPVGGTVTNISGGPGGNPRTAGYGVTIDGRYFYKHLGTLGPRVKVGARLGAGELLGTLDPTTQGGPHLHLGAISRSALNFIAALFPTR